MKSWMKPKWKHTCKKCEYLGSMFLHNKFADWYLCNGLDPSVVARFSDDGADYWSSSPSMVEQDRFLTSRNASDEHGFSEMQILARFMLTQRES